MVNEKQKKKRLVMKSPNEYQEFYRNSRNFGVIFELLITFHLYF
jgi:hypothetical protein